MRAAIALGSNLPSAFGDPAANLRKALHQLRSVALIVAVSCFYETEPVGYLDQPRFLNAAALLDTELSPHSLLTALLSIEKAMGRDRTGSTPPKGPRIIDLDLLLYEDAGGQSLVLHQDGLILPHPELDRRSFVLDPLAEIAPTMLHPTRGHSIGRLARDLTERRIT